MRAYILALLAGLGRFLPFSRSGGRPREVFGRSVFNKALILLGAAFVGWAAGKGWVKFG